MKSSWAQGFECTACGHLGLQQPRCCPNCGELPAKWKEVAIRYNNLPQAAWEKKTDAEV